MADKSGCCRWVTWFPYERITSAVSACPQSWLTMIGWSSAEGRCCRSLSRQRLTVTLLQAITRIGMTGWVGTTTFGLSLFHSDLWFWICSRISFCISSSASNVSAICRTSPTTSLVGLSATSLSSRPGLTGWLDGGLPHSRSNSMAFQVITRNVPQRMREPFLRNMAQKLKGREVGLGGQALLNRKGCPCYRQ